MEHLVGMFGPDDEEEELTTKVEESSKLPAALPPEEEEGNVEYKLKLVSPTEERVEHLVTQMKWRLEEGCGEAIYQIGVEDNGFLAGLTDSELDASLHTLRRMADRLGASLEVVRDRATSEPGASPRRRALEVLVRKVPDDQQFIDLKLAVLGNVDVGKSTLLGVLTQGQLDNGRGRARLNLFRHLHEIQSGRTSSISHEILGFDGQGQVVNYSDCRSVEEIIERSSKLITLIDLAGHHKYQRTTVLGLTGSAPDFAMLVVSANNGIVGTTREHLGYALALRVPVFVVVTKVDACRPPALARTLAQLEAILKSPGVARVPLRVCGPDDAVMAAATLEGQQTAAIFTVSSVTGGGLDLLKQFLNLLPPATPRSQREARAQDPALFLVDEIFSIPGVGSVVAGVVDRGSIREGEELQLGPADDGSYRKVKVKSVHRNRLPCRMIAAGQAACVGLHDVDRGALRKGMVLMDMAAPPTACMQFEADIYVLFHQSHLAVGCQTTVHLGTVCQPATILSLDQEEVRTNQKARAVFEFRLKPEHVRVGSRLLFRDGHAKGMGEVMKVMTCGGEGPEGLR